MEVDVTPVHAQFGNVFAIRERLAADADRVEPVRWHRHLLDLIARERQRLGSRVERFLDLLLRRAELHTDLQHREVADGFGRPYLGQSVDRGVANLDRARPDAWYLAIRRERDGGDGAREIVGYAITSVAGKHRREPDQAAEARGIFLVHHVGCRS